MQAQKKWSLLHELGQFSLAPYCHNLREATSPVSLLFPTRAIWSCSYLADNAALLGLLNCLHTCPAGLLDSYTRTHSESATHLLPRTHICMHHGPQNSSLPYTVQYSWNKHIVEHHIKATKKKSFLIQAHYHLISSLLYNNFGSQTGLNKQNSRPYKWRLGPGMHL